ncbi:MAG: CofH family radical SAM protein [Phycisphaerales bacterium]|nr:MAG: CofH family radical SAM protein [Phycisphaerales bacterium]
MLANSPAGGVDLRPVADKVESAERLDFEDGLRLVQSNDIHEIGRLANLVRERWHARKAFYNINRHINYANYCVLRCKFCSFYRPYPKGRPKGAAAKGGYELTVEQVAELAKEAYDQGATEVHIVGGLHPRLPFEYYVDMCRTIRQACPRMHIKAFTAIEIIHFTRISRPRLSIRQVLERLRDAGLDSLPGGGAEIFDDRVHAEAYKNKVGEQGWFDVHREAHEMGIFTNATMLYGHVETPAERVRHLIKMRDHQDESLASRRAHFNCCVPLSFVPEGSELAHLPGPTGLTDLKTLALARLMLDNVPHIKAFWPMLSAKLAQVGLNWGVDDLDGTVVYYDITKREGGLNQTHQELSVDKIKRLIVEADCVPLERDSLYRLVERRGDDWHIIEKPIFSVR